MNSYVLSFSVHVFVFLFYYVFISFKRRSLETNLPNKTPKTEQPGLDFYKLQAPELKVPENALDT